MRLTRAFLFCFAVLALSSASAWAQSGSVSQRHFTFHYAFTVRNVAKGSPIRIWFPRATSDEFQTVSIVSRKGDLPLKTAREPEYGNETFYAETPNAERDEYSFEVVYIVDRHEASSHSAQPQTVQLTRYLSPDKLVPTSGLPAQLAAEQTSHLRGQLDKVHAIYNYVLANMRYDKSGTGWGHGDTLYACNAKHGNCTDFHSLFISMARSQQIPARFEIGFPLPQDKHSGDIAGYHCWADFYTRSTGWTPVDISEAWKHPEQRDYFFGHWDDNRIQFSVGRDITLSPRQDGASLNYFVYPYVEVAGKEFPNISNHFSFEDENPAARTSAAGEN